MGEVVHHGEGEITSISNVTEIFSDGASALDTCVDLYAFLTHQDEFLKTPLDRNPVLDTTQIVQAKSWLRLISNGDG